MAITGHHHNENCGNPVALVDLDGEVTKTI
jgi:hypothetical protein